MADQFTASMPEAPNLNTEESDLNTTGYCQEPMEIDDVRRLPPQCPYPTESIEETRCICHNSPEGCNNKACQPPPPPLKGLARRSQSDTHRFSQGVDSHFENGRASGYQTTESDPRPQNLQVARDELTAMESERQFQKERKALENYYRTELNKKEHEWKTEKTAMQHKLDKAMAAARKNASQINSLRAEDRYRVTDDYLMKEHRSLCLALRDWAVTYFFGPPRTLPSDAYRNASAYKHFLSRVCLDPDAYLESEEDCPKIVQAYIWYLLYKELSNQDEWAGESRACFGCLKEILYAGSKDASTAQRNFQRWRATSSRLIQERVSKNYIEKKVAAFCIYIREPLDPWLRNGSDPDTYAGELTWIVEKAFKFEMEISKQTAIVELLSPYRALSHSTSGRGWAGAVFDPETMEDYKETEDPTSPSASTSTPATSVFLIMSPGLKKHGNSSGDNYSDSVLLGKMKVSRDPPPPPPRARRGTRSEEASHGA